MTSAQRSPATERCSMKKYEYFVAALDVLRRAPEQDLAHAFVQSGGID